jgi:virginiamycin B lyase
MKLKEYALPWEDARPRRIQVTSDDQVWYVDWVRGSLGHLDPATGKVEEWVSPAGSGSKPYAMAVDSQDRLWFVETAPDPNQFVGFDPKTREFFSRTKVPSGGGTIRHMMFNRSAGEIWFGTDTNTIGRAKVLP